MSAEVVQHVPAGRMSEAEYTSRRAQIAETYGKSAAERSGLYDQAMAKLFYVSGWTQEKLAQQEGRNRSWVARRLLFGRYLGFVPNGTFPKSLTEGRFRDYWSRTDADEINENVRFREVARLMAEELTIAKPPLNFKPIGAAIKSTSATGDWHRLSTIVTKVQAVVPDATTENVEAVLLGMVRLGSYNTFAEKKKGAPIYRVVLGGKVKIDLVAFKHEVGPLIEKLKVEGKKNMATASPPSVRYLAFQLEKLIDKMAGLTPPDGAQEE